MAVQSPPINISINIRMGRTQKAGDFQCGNGIVPLGRTRVNLQSNLGHMKRLPNA